MIDIFDRKSQLINNNIYEQYNITLDKLTSSLNQDISYHSKLIIMESIIDIHQKKKEYIYQEYASLTNITTVKIN